MTCRMAIIYNKLPDDLKRVIREYFIIWQRFGFKHRPEVLVPKPNRYFNTIRKCPNGAIWNPVNPSSLIYSHQHLIFQFYLSVNRNNDTEDKWEIAISPQSTTTTITRTRDPIIHLMESKPWLKNIPPYSRLIEEILFESVGIIILEFIVTRPDIYSPPSRHSMAESFIQFVIQINNYDIHHLNK